MFFILSKVLLWFTYPLSWVLILLLLQLCTKSARLKRRYRIAAIIVFLLFSNTWLVNQFARIWDVSPTQLPNHTYSCAIVLGGFVNIDRHEQGYFSPEADRFIQTALLYKQGKVDHILVTGGNGSLMHHDLKESEWASQQLQLLGVPQQAILLETKSRNTFENAAFTKRVLDSVHLQPPYLLVTSAFHMRRSEWVFNHERIPVVPYPCNYFAGRDAFKLEDILPKSRALELWVIYTKEVIGYVAYYIKGKL